MKQEWVCGRSWQRACVSSYTHSLAHSLTRPTDETYERLFLLVFPSFASYEETCELIGKRFYEAGTNIIQQERVVKFLSRWIKMLPLDFAENTEPNKFINTFLANITDSHQNASAFLSKLLSSPVSLSLSLSLSHPLSTALTICRH